MSSPQTPAEWTELAVRAQARDSQAVDMLAVALGLLARKIFRCANLSPEDAEELGWESVWHIFERLDRFRGREFLAWAKAILKNKLRDHFRQLRRRPPTVPLLKNDEDTLVAEPALGANGVLDEAGHAALEDALRQLPAADRKLVESQAGFQRVSFRQMAGELGLSEAAARVRYHRAKHRLKVILEDDPRMKAWIALETSAVVVETKQQRK